MLPFVAVGAALTASVVGAIFGAPLLAGSLALALSARRVWRNPADLAAKRRLGNLALGAAILLTGVLLAVIVVGRDDIDSVVDWVAVAIGMLWVGALWSSTSLVRGAVP